MADYWRKAVQWIYTAVIKSHDYSRPITVLQSGQLTETSEKKINWIFFGLFVMINNNIFHNVDDVVQKIKRLKLPINNMLFWLYKRKANYFDYSMIKYTISTDKHVLIFCLFTFRIDKVWNKILSVGIQWTSVRFGENLLL